MDIFIVAVRVPVVVNLLGVHNGEEVRDRDVLGADVRAVAAGRAGDEVLAVEDLLHLFHRGALGLVEGLKSRMNEMLSCICSMLLMPESTIIMPGKPATKRMA